MTKKHKITLGLLAVSVLINLVQFILPVHIFRASHMDMKFECEPPQFTDRERDLIRKVPHDLLSEVTHLNSSYITSIEETDDEITFHTAQLNHLQTFSFCVNSFSVYSGVTHDGVGPAVIFDKEMRVKKLIPLWGEEVLYENGKPSK